MFDKNDRLLAELSGRLTTRLCEELTPLRPQPAPPQMTAELHATLASYTGLTRANIDLIDMEVDKILERELSKSPLGSGVMKLQNAARDVHIFLYNECSLYIPAKTVFAALKSEVEAMRAEQGLNRDARTP